MSGAGVPQLARGFVSNAIPHGEIKVVLAVHGKGSIEREQDFAGIAEIHAWKVLRTQNVHDGYREQSRANTMGTDIQQIHGKVLVIQPTITERVATKLTRGNKPPVRLHPVIERRGQQ